mmetsp:Transcript_5648/g.8770  ORF Transcript_5648/g.8770 Transcript_5648/m.8770 type:complete len:238 (-) Transcript_5648:1156-1869(-)
MASLLAEVRPKPRVYLDRTQYPDIESQNAAAATSTTVYIGGLSYYTTEEQIYTLMSKCGLVDRIIMGLHRLDRKPCGFCFVVFRHRQSVIMAESLLTGVRFDGKTIKVEIDPGFREGRQYGRARSGGQARDERERERQFGMRGGFRGRGRGRGGRGRSGLFGAERSETFGHIQYNRRNDDGDRGQKRARNDDEPAEKTENGEEEKENVSDDEMERRRIRRRRRRGRRGDSSDDEDSD